MRLDLDLPTEQLPPCEHECVCGTCNDYDRRDCNSYQAKVDRDLLVLAASITANEGMWQSNIDKVTAKFVAETVCDAIGMDLCQITYDTQSTTEATA